MLVVAVIVVVFDLIVLVGFLRFHHQNLDGCFEIAGGCSTAAVAPKNIFIHIVINVVSCELLCKQ